LVKALKRRQQPHWWRKERGKETKGDADPGGKEGERIPLRMFSCKRFLHKNAVKRD